MQNDVETQDINLSSLDSLKLSCSVTLGDLEKELRTLEFGLNNFVREVTTGNDFSALAQAQIGSLREQVEMIKRAAEQCVQYFGEDTRTRTIGDVLNELYDFLVDFLKCVQRNNNHGAMP